MIKPSTSRDDLLDQLQGLYQRDPDHFEAVRQELIRRAIEDFPPDRQLRAWGVQFRLEATLRHYRHPIARMNKMVEILWRQLEEFRQVLNEPLRSVRDRESRRGPAKVLPLPPRKISD